MKITFKYDPKKECENFLHSLHSLNHGPSQRHKLFFEHFSELNEDNAVAFADWYIKENNISMEEKLAAIEKQWREVEAEFFKRADTIYHATLLQSEIVVYLSVHDRCSYSFERNYFFVHLDLLRTNKVIMHELWHFYFYFTVGREIEKKYDRQLFNDIKESLTVLLNEEFSDLLQGLEDKGYLIHQEMRQEMVKRYRQNRDIYALINSFLTTN